MLTADHSLKSSDGALDVAIDSAAVRDVRRTADVEHLPIADFRLAKPLQSLRVFLFTDIVGSTEIAARLGDEDWYALLFRHDAIVRSCLDEHGGEEIDTAGDGFFATFDRPSCAVRCAASIRAALASIGIDVRAGVHAGECEVARGRVVGVAVHVAARVAHVALAGEILVSSTVRDLLAGSNLRFSGREWQALKGLSESRQLFAFEG